MFCVPTYNHTLINHKPRIHPFAQASVAMDHFKKREVLHLEGDPVRAALEYWMARMFDSEEFNNKKAYYNMDQVVYGWKVARGDL